ncbi:acetylglucosaminyltransferase-like protein [Elsinoe australis]|uniref:Acetylglucosaminyltransferase-like protein n=1 Tax=Elsinoe australis TaxID=40998 RepID=A0A4U7B6Y1_9PEZI|nr:acetylglucosaminyltransferase-like protein [Elsinoe australis]
MHNPPVRGGIGSYLLSRSVRILFFVFLVFAVISLIPLHTTGGEQYRLSHYVYKPKPATPLGFTEEGWRHGFGKPGGPPAKSKEEQGIDKPVQDKQTEKAQFDTGPVVDGQAVGHDTSAAEHNPQDVQGTDRAIVGVPISHESSGNNSPYAYVFYATEDAYACGVLINIDRLQNGFKTKHRIFVLMTRDLSRAYRDAFAARNVTVSVQNAPKMPSSSAAYYVNCLVKLYAFKMHHIDPSLRRVLMIDSDQLILQNLDHLFADLPEVDLAAPRAYWSDKGKETIISSTFMLINLSERLWHRVEAATQHIGNDKYDMDIINELLGDTALVLPGKYVTINSHWETWDLPNWYHEEEDFSKIEVEEPIKIDANAEIAGEKVDEVAGHAGHNFHPPPDNSGRHWRRFEPAPADIAHAKPDAAPVLTHPREKSESAIQAPSEVAEVEVSTTWDSKEDPPALPDKEGRKLYKELFQLYPTAAVLHFFALGKPWTWPIERVIAAKKDAHPVFYQQFREWRSAALESCPKGLIDAL